MARVLWRRWAAAAAPQDDPPFGRRRRGAGHGPSGDFLPGWRRRAGHGWQDNLRPGCRRRAAPHPQYDLPPGCWRRRWAEPNATCPYTYGRRLGAGSRSRPDPRTARAKTSTASRSSASSAATAATRMRASRSLGPMTIARSRSSIPSLVKSAVISFFRWSSRAAPPASHCWQPPLLRVNARTLPVGGSARAGFAPVVRFQFRPRRRHRRPDVST